MAAHAIKAGEGDVFIAAGVETVSRYAAGASDKPAPNLIFGEVPASGTAERALGGSPDWKPLRGAPRHLHRDGADG